MEAFHQFIILINSYIWGMPMLILLIGTHLYLSFKLKFIQKYIFKAIKLSFSKDKGATGDVSQFSALTTSLAATLGTGNIIGIAMFQGGKKGEKGGGFSYLIWGDTK